VLSFGLSPALLSTLPSPSTHPPGPAVRAARSEERRFVTLALAIVLGVGLVQIHWGERIAAGQGQGWDGRFYAEMARDFPGQVLGRKLDAYRLGRIVPSAVVFAALEVLGLPHDDRHIVTTFAAYNLVLLAAAVILWSRIARLTGLSHRGRWLGFLLLFVNFANLRMPFYYPVSTDTTAFFLGTLLTYLHLRQAVAAMAFVLVAGAFTWPSFLGMGALLFVFRPAAWDEAGAPRRGHAIAAAALAVLYLALIPGNPHLRLQPDRSAAVDGRLLPLSLAVVVAYVVLASAPLLRDRRLFRLRTWKTGFRPWRALVVLAVAVLAHVTVEGLSSGSRISEPTLYLRQLPVRALLKPGVFLVAHAAYLGVLVPLLVVAWGRAARAAHALGAPFTAFLAAVLALGLTPESRQVLHGLTALALVAVLALEGLRWPRWGTLLLVGSALVSTKAWLSLNGEGFIGKSDPFSHPAQRYFMNLGPWMGYESYALQGGIALAVTVGLAFAHRHARRAVGPEEPWTVSPRLLKAAAIGLGVLALAVALEWGSRRALRPRPITRGDGSVSDPLLGWANAPGAEVRIEGPPSVRVRFNRSGLRGPERPEEKPQGVRRVLLLGDGFAEGYSVDEPHVASSVLERTLVAGGCPTEVINGGMAGFSTDQEYLFFRSRGRRFRPDPVALFLYSDDLAHNLRGRRGKPYLDVGAGLEVRPPATVERDRLRTAELEYVQRGRWHGSAALRLASNALLAAPAPVRRAALRWGLAEKSRPPFELWPYSPSAETREMWRRERVILEALRDEVVRAGGRLVILYVPARWEVDDDAWSALLETYTMSPVFWQRDRVARRLAVGAAELGVPVVDPRADLRREAAEGRAAYESASGLWTAAGHAVAARRLAAFIADSRLCPASR